GHAGLTRLGLWSYFLDLRLRGDDVMVEVFISLECPGFGLPPSQKIIWNNRRPSADYSSSYFAPSREPIFQGVYSTISLGTDEAGSCQHSSTLKTDRYRKRRCWQPRRLPSPS